MLTIDRANGLNNNDKELERLRQEINRLQREISILKQENTELKAELAKKEVHAEEKVLNNIKEISDINRQLKMIECVLTNNKKELINILMEDWWQWVRLQYKKDI